MRRDETYSFRSSREKRYSDGVIWMKREKPSGQSRPESGLIAIPCAAGYLTGGVREEKGS